MKSRECVCGCDREVPLPLTGVNTDALTVQAELWEWDRYRNLMQSLANYGDGAVSYDGQLDPFIEAGGRHYHVMLDAIHGNHLLLQPPDMKEIKRWIKFSRKNRKPLGRGTGLVRTDKNLGPRPEDLGELDRLEPERSFTGPDPDGRKLAEAAGLLEKGDENG